MCCVGISLKYVNGQYAHKCQTNCSRSHVCLHIYFYCTAVVLSYLNHCTIYNVYHIQVTQLLYCCVMFTFVFAFC